MSRTIRTLFVVLFFITTTAEARVISYAPVSDKFASPAIQKRTNRYFALVESQHGDFAQPRVSAPVPPPMRAGQLVIYDSKGEHEPRVVLPRNGSGEVPLPVAAVWERADGVARIFVLAAVDTEGNPSGRIRPLYSPDGGATWIALPVPENEDVSAFFRDDTGGPIVRARGSQVRLGPEQTPFLFAATDFTNYTPGDTSIYAVDANGTLRRLMQLQGGSGAAIIGTSQDGSRILVAGTPKNASSGGRGLRVVHSSGEIADAIVPLSSGYFSEGWITATGDVYLESNEWGETQSLSLIRNGVRSTLAEAPPGTSVNFEPTLFAVPTADYSGAWIVRRGIGSPTVLLRHTPGAPPVVQWSDISAPQVEAIHTARSNERLLIQVHRPRAQVQGLIIDPALAIWNAGDPAPAHYDELFVSEGIAKTFVHLDVDEVARGGFFVFDSAATTFVPPPPISSGGGGGDVAQEWGVIKASLQQRLLIPSISRVAGMHGSSWRSDLILQNDQSVPTEVEYHFTPTTDGAGETRGTITLRPRELRLYDDAVHSLLGAESGGGALFLTPKFGSSITATSRTYSQAEKGTFGMGMGAVDLATAGSARFPFSFSGAIQGADTRTNVLVTDASGRGSAARFQAQGIAGAATADVMVGPRRQVQTNNLAAVMQLHPGESAGVTARVVDGEAIFSVVSIDNKTNDPTYFTPDLSSSLTRTIPIIGHVTGAGGAEFRSDLFLYNPTANVRGVLLAAKRWDTNEPELRLNLNLLPFETKVVRNALPTLFGISGIARLRFVSGMPGESAGIRVSSRTYSIDANGGTYGFVMPPLNAFQLATSGEALEILGAVADPAFRTNLALVELSQSATGGTARVRIGIIDEEGRDIDSFETSLPIAGGVQLVDLFSARNIAGTRRPLLIRVETLAGTVAAFATTIDNGTNDPTYLSANLAAQE